MLIGAHVSNAGGPATPSSAALERDCDAIQIFNQSPRPWKPTAYTDEDFAAFNEAMDGLAHRGVIIHAVYLINCASEDEELRDEVADRADALAAAPAPRSAPTASSCTPGRRSRATSARRSSGPAKVIAEALEETDGCPLHLENTAGAGGTLGRSFGELAALLDAAGGGKRLGVCLDSCHLLASGYDVRTRRRARGRVDAFDAEVGLDRLRLPARQRLR